MIFRPDIKPPMWGPLSAVQYAVRANAERMGIDFFALSFVPLWENAGDVARDCGGFSNPMQLVGTQWSASRVVVANTAESYCSYGVLPVAGEQDISLIFRGKVNSLAAGDNGFITAGGYYNTGSGVSLASNSSGRLEFSSARSFYRYKNNTVPIGRTTNLGAVYSAGGSFAFILDGSLLTTFDGSGGSFGVLPSTTSPTVIGLDDVYPGLDVDTSLIYKGVLTSDQVARLYVRPYALLMPVSRPVYFDLGAGGVTFSASCGSTLSSSDIQASIARSLAASAAASLTGSDIAVTTAASYLLSAACHASISSSDILTSILRNLTADASASTTSSNILAAVARILIASADGSLTGSDIAVSIAAQKIFEAACNASLQSTDVLASILRQVQAQCDGSLTSQDTTLAILRQLVASCAGSLTASDITVDTVAQKLFEAACAASLTSSDSALNIARTLSCNCNGVVSSSDATLTIAGLITFLAECTASLSGSDVTASIARVLSAESLASVSSADIVVTNLVSLAATCDSTVSAADIALNLQMYLQAVCAGTLSADDASLSVAALLSAACGATISSSDIRVLFTDEFMLPEIFAAISKITKAYEAESLVTKTLNARSRIEIRRLN